MNWFSIAVSHVKNGAQCPRIDDQPVSSISKLRSMAWPLLVFIPKLRPMAWQMLISDMRC
jgi:hypothetical protein